MIPGSSPLARGPRAVIKLEEFITGLIPARAGTTNLPRRVGRGGGAHPRSRGDHSFNLHGEQGVKGSSPLARGTSVPTNGRRRLPRLIPARAGNTRCRSRCHGYWWAHPRSRGEHRTLTLPRLPAEGSSPLARGPPNVFPDRGNNVRLIPARAGTTATSVRKPPAARAHPRSRGDHAHELPFCAT